MVEWEIQLPVEVVEGSHSALQTRREGGQARGKVLNAAPRWSQPHCIAHHGCKTPVSH